MRRDELIKSGIMTFLAIVVMFLILFPVYYIFTVSIKPAATIATTELDLIPDKVTGEAYREVLFGLRGTRISEEFTGTLEGFAKIVGGKLQVENGVIKGEVKYGPFTGIRFEVPVGGLSFELSQQVNEVQGNLKAEISGIISLTRVNSDGTIGLGVIKNVTLKSGEVNGLKISEGKLAGFIRIRDSGKAELTAIGKFVNSKFFHHLRNSLILATLTVFLTLLFVVPAAYAFSRLKFFGREHILYFYLMFTQVAGGLGIAGLIALYGMLVKLGLYNKLPALAIIYAAGSVPFNTWLLKSYIDSISPDFDEAALVDGASYLQIIRYVLLPMALPGIATVAVMSFIGGWTEFILASLLLTEENQPLSVWIYTLMGGIGRGIDWNYFAAAALLFALPVFIMFMLAQNYIRSGLTVGGLKE
ncbi:MAG: arabinogalactan oligomer / maltooligosaccharide transport system permease protein [Pyrococcus sp.]|uniref:ABC transporter permease subunit n=1 Tax=Pyrococcus sp. TaxID=33866 RepID=UPI0025892CD2|nr:ABC transporter permease subunit [Pyrococcus sp.]MDK2869400.1 arabinogalactan oligomer / maltooligosaccharide transport system permease protein [Pyrococcus sp.]